MGKYVSVGDSVHQYRDKYRLKYLPGIILRVSVVAIIVFLIASRYDFFEFVTEYVEQHEEYDLDEFIMVGAVLIWWVLGELIVLLKKIHDQSKEFEIYAMYDPLTRIMNRRGFFKATEAQFESRIQSEEICLLMIDIKEFKVFNDAHGHKVGDEILVDIAEQLTALLEEGDIVARIGGDEFAIVTDACEDTCHTPYNGHLNNAFRVVCDHGKLEFDVNLNYGVAASPYDGKTIDDLMVVADKRMYSHKHEIEN